MDSSFAERLERLIRALEVQTNLLGRLVALEEAKRTRQVSGRATRTRRVADDKPIPVTPIVAAAVRRALARVNRGSHADE